MDSDKFDKLTRLLGDLASRRRLVQGTAATVASAALTQFGAEESEAKKKAKPKKDKSTKVKPKKAAPKAEGSPKAEAKLKAGGKRLDAKNCTPDGNRCGKRKPGKPTIKPCRFCCSQYTGGKGNRCRCRPDGVKCRPGRPDQCCSGVCSGRVCGFLS